MRTLMIVAAIAFAAGAPVAHAQKVDANGKCHDAKGKMAKMELCIGASTRHSYKLDPQGQCRDETGHFAEAINCPHQTPGGPIAH